MVGFTAKRFKNPQKERQTLELTDTKVLNDKFYLESKEMVIKKNMLYNIPDIRYD